MFGILVSSALPVLKALGQTVAIGILSRLLLALVLAQPLAVKLNPPASRIDSDTGQ